MWEKLLLAATITFSLQFFISTTQINIGQTESGADIAETPRNGNEYVLVKTNQNSQPNSMDN